MHLNSPHGIMMNYMYYQFLLQFVVKKTITQRKFYNIVYSEDFNLKKLKEKRKKMVFKEAHKILILCAYYVNIGNIRKK